MLQILNTVLNKAYGLEDQISYSSLDGLLKIYFLNIL